jgi:hypothetical protein
MKAEKSLPASAPRARDPAACARGWEEELQIQFSIPGIPQFTINNSLFNYEHEIF